VHVDRLKKTAMSVSVVPTVHGLLFRELSLEGVTKIFSSGIFFYYF